MLFARGCLPLGAGPLRRRGGGCGCSGHGACGIPTPVLVLDDQALEHVLDDGLLLGRQLTDRFELQHEVIVRATARVLPYIGR